MTLSQARHFLADVHIEGQGKIDFIEIDEGRKIEFSNMSDDDALLAAELVADLLAEISRRKGQTQ